MGRLVFFKKMAGLYPAEFFILKGMFVHYLSKNVAESFVFDFFNLFFKHWMYGWRFSQSISQFFVIIIVGHFVFIFLPSSLTIPGTVVQEMKATRSIRLESWRELLIGSF